MFVVNDNNDNNNNNILNKIMKSLPLLMKPLFLALLVAFPPLVAAQTGPVIPGAGTILQQVQPVAPPPRSSTGTDLTINREADVKLPPGAPFLVNTIRITGNKKIATATLHALVAEGEGKSLTLVQLGTLATRITEYYRSQGYPLARAIIPAQTIRAGIVEIQIIVARYGKINLDNRSRVDDSLLQATLSPLQIGEEIQQQGLDKTLLLLSDIPGVLVNAKLKPGDAVGTSDLEVNTMSGPAVSGNIGLDNYGNRFTGKPRITGSVNIIDPLNLKFSNVLSISALSSGDGLNHGRIAYESVVNGQGTRLGGSYSALRYRLGDSLASLNGNGTARVGSLFAKHPFLRGPDANLYGQIQYDNLQLRDRIDFLSTKTDRHLNNWTLSLTGDARDTLLSGGINTWSLGWTTGRVGFDNTAAQLLDANTAATRGGFSKLNANFARYQNLGPKDGLYMAFSGQLAGTNLDSSQKMSVGGPNSVRAYDAGAVSGDSGYLGTVELRHDLGTAWQGQLQAVAFVDSANVTVNKNIWVAGTNSASLSGAGAGLNWAGLDQWSARTYVAVPIGSTPALVSATKSARAWMEVSKRF